METEDENTWARYVLKTIDDGDENVTDWEARFIESNLDRASFTEAQLTVIQQMADKYL